MNRFRPLREMLASSMVLFLAACNTTETELRTGAGEHSTFHVDLPYSAVMKNFQAAATKCFAGGSNAAYITVSEVDVSPGHAGRILITQFAMVGTRALLVADISAAANGTDVEYSRHHIMIVDNAQPILEAWAAGLDKGCGLPFN